MTDILVAPEDFDPKDRKENKNHQNGSEENTQDSNTEKKSPIRDTKLLTDLVNETDDEEIETTEEAQKPIVPVRDPGIWERRSVDEEEETVEDNGKEVDPNPNNEVRDYKGSNKKLANMNTVRDQKKRKYDRLVGEMNEYKAELKRGYKIVKNDDGQASHVPLTSAEKDVISFKISDLDYERFMLRIEIQGLDQKISQIATKKRTNRIAKKQKASRSQKEDKLVQRVGRELSKAAKNGNARIVSEIKSQIQSENRSDAYNSIKSFLSKEVKTVAKKLDKDKELENQVIDRVLNKLAADQS